MIPVVVEADPEDEQQVAVREESQRSAVPAAPPLDGVVRVLNERSEFALFVKLLFFHLEQKPKLRVKAKSIVRDCTNEHRIGGETIGDLSLMEFVEEKLRPVVGDALWNHTWIYLQQYCRRRGICIGRLSTV